MNKMICVIGAGYWGKNHIKTLYKLNALGGVVDLNNNTLKVISSSYPGINTHLELKDALKLNSIIFYLCQMSLMLMTKS